MLKRIIEGSIRNRFLVLLGVAFLVLWGARALLATPIDAIPDLSDVQVIVYTEYPGQAPRIVEDQVTYPLTTADAVGAGAKVVRGYSFFGYSFVYVIFEDGTDIYWARSRVLEYLNYAQARLPARRDADPRSRTPPGWAGSTSTPSTADRRDLAELRSHPGLVSAYDLTSRRRGLRGGQPRWLREAVSGGGRPEQGCVAYGLPIAEVEMAIRAANADVGGEVIEMGGDRVHGARPRLHPVAGRPRERRRRCRPEERHPDPASATWPTSRSARRCGAGSPSGTARARRSAASWSCVSAKNALKIIDPVKDKLELRKAGLPDGRDDPTAYDRSGLIERAIATLKEQAPRGEHRRGPGDDRSSCSTCASALVAIITLPVGDPDGLHRDAGPGAQRQHHVARRHRHRHRRDDRRGHHHDRERAQAPGATRRAGQPAAASSARSSAMRRTEVGPTLFYSLLVITVSFVPVFTLEATGGPAVQAAGLHQDLRDGCRGLPLGHPGAGADGLVHPRQDQPGDSANPLNRLPDPGLPPGRAVCSGVGHAGA